MKPVCDNCKKIIETEWLHGAQHPECMINWMYNNFGPPTQKPIAGIEAKTKDPGLDIKSENNGR